MSSEDVTWTVVLRGPPRERVVLDWFELAARDGLSAANPLWVVLASGEGMAPFERIDAAARYLCSHGGLVSVTGAADQDELSISVHLMRGALQTELPALGDSPRFDEVRLDIPARAVARRRAAWRVFESSLLEATAGDGVFAWCASEAAIEGSIPTRVHEHIAREQIPTVPLLAAAVPSESALSQQLVTKAPSLGLKASHVVSGWHVYVADDSFWARD